MKWIIFKPIEKIKLKADFKKLMLIAEIKSHPISVNQIWRMNMKSRRSYKIPIAVAWQAVAIMAIKTAAYKLWGAWDLSAYRGQPLRLKINFIRDTWHGKTKAKKHLYVRPDLSNFIKATEDAVMDALNLDDSAIVELICRKVEVRGIVDTVAIGLEFMNE